MDMTDKQIAFWVKNPARITAPNDSTCCGAPAFIMRVATGGFVKEICSKCQNTDTLTGADFLSLKLWVSCPGCDSPMTAASVLYGNYGFQCQQCNQEIKFADLLPLHSDTTT